MTLPLALTCGEPAGIGGEIALKAWQARTGEGVPPFLLLDDPERIAGLARHLGWDVPVAAIGTAAEANETFPHALPVLAHDIPAAVAPGHPSPANGQAVLDAVRRAVALAKAGDVSGVVTNPIAKHILYQAGFAHPGHTEYLADLAAEGGPAPTPVMMLACSLLRVVPVTIHVPFVEVPKHLTRDRIVEVGRITAAALARDFRIARPRLAVTGLNPHAGEGGALGREELDVIEPAIEILRADGHIVQGPLAADTMFHPPARERYDVALCMYHDQALIPIKTLDFQRGVNVTLGLPFVRTSPDHGTAFSLAGTGEADPLSLIEALKTAGTMAEGRARAAAASLA